MFLHGIEASLCVNNHDIAVDSVITDVFFKERGNMTLEKFQEFFVSGQLLWQPVCSPRRDIISGVVIVSLLVNCCPLFLYVVVVCLSQSSHSSTCTSTFGVTNINCFIHLVIDSFSETSVVSFCLLDEVVT